MISIAFTCPKLGFLLGLTAHPRARTRDFLEPLLPALDAVGGTVRNQHTWCSVEIADSVDAVLALDPFTRAVAMTHDITVVSIVGSRAAVEMLADPVAALAWETLRAEIVTDSGAPPDFTHGIVAARHYKRLVAWPVPDAIAEYHVPPGLTLLTVTDGAIVVVDRELAIGSDVMADVVIDDGGRAHNATIVRTGDGWRLRRAENGRITVAGDHSPEYRLAPGMVIQLAYPHAIIVLEVP